MNIYDLLSNYRTTPSLEIEKIEDLFGRGKYDFGSFATLENVLHESYLRSIFASYETSFPRFLTNIVFKDCNTKLDTPELLIRYRYFCEVIAELCFVASNGYYSSLFKGELNHLFSVVKEGLFSLGYVFVEHEKHLVTQKIDETAETIAATSPDHAETIFNYLLAKSVLDKASALLDLSIKLEAKKQKSGFGKDAREWVQLLRHKEEKIKDPKYSWFFDDDSYENNLDKLFKIFLGMIACEESNDYLVEFRNKKGS